jgi:hypothetical protein
MTYGSAALLVGADPLGKIRQAARISGCVDSALFPPKSTRSASRTRCRRCPGSH